MELDHEETIILEQAKIIDDLTERIGEALSYLDWYSAIMPDSDEPYVEQIVKLLEGVQEH